MCKECFTKVRNTITSFSMDYNGNTILVRNVPCVECIVCGEKMYNDDVAEKLESIVNDVKNMIQDLSVVDYNKIA